MGAPSARVAELAQNWAREGHQVSILTGFPNHPTGIVPDEWRARLRRLVYREKVGCIDVFRTWLWPLPNRKAHERIRNYTSFFVSAAVRGLTLPRPDVVIATSPQLLVALAGWWLAFARRLPFVFEVRDLWPESLTAVGIGDQNSLLHLTLKAVAGFLYERAHRIVVVTPAFREYLIEHWRIAPEKISVVENGVEADTFCPQAGESNLELRAQIQAEGKFLVGYVGTMGMAHGLETLLDAAQQLSSQNPSIQFVLIGEGAEKERIQKLAQIRGIQNIRFFDQQSRERIPALISACDCCLVLLKKADVFKTVIPTKMLEFMSCARPVILAVEGQARKILEEAEAGIAVEPENATQLAQAVATLAANRDRSRRQGVSGREYILEHYSRKSTAEKYSGILEHLFASHAI
jgi:colanic acid biosynthesis glycosyl transferase WcaI